MAETTKKDRDLLYSRAQSLSEQANQCDMWADQLKQDMLTDRAAGHRKVAEALRGEAFNCRHHADQVS